MPEQIITVIGKVVLHIILMIMQQAKVFIRLLTQELIHTQARKDILRQTIMGFTIWRGMYGNGITIGIWEIGIRRQGQQMLTHADLHPAPTACCAAAVGAATPATRGAPFATATRHRAATSAGASGACVLVNRGTSKR